MFNVSKDLPETDKGQVYLLKYLDQFADFFKALIVGVGLTAIGGKVSFSDTSLLPTWLAIYALFSPVVLVAIAGAGYLIVLRRYRQLAEAAEAAGIDPTFKLQLDTRKSKSLWLRALR